LEEMMPATVEVERNVKNVVEGEIVYPSDKFPICPSFSELQEQKFNLTNHVQPCLNLLLEAALAPETQS
jgi:hypothetical protein